MIKAAGCFGSLVVAVLLLLAGFSGAAQEARCESELIFPPETWHNHSSCVVETPSGDLLVCWFHGSGERTADDVKIEGARKRKGQRGWGQRFTLADTPGYPDTNCAMFIDPQDRLWLIWPTILANLWETALLKVWIASDYEGYGAPDWDSQKVLHVTPGPEFTEQAIRFWDEAQAGLLAGQVAAAGVEEAREYFATLRKRAEDKLSRRLGWMTRAHPVVIEGGRLIVPLYSDGFDCSLMAITDDWGATWRTSTPLLGLGNIQPSVVQRRDGSLLALMRDNGPPPKRLHQSESHDRGETWTPVVDSPLPNPGAGAEVIRLRNGSWVLISNDTEQGRHSLAVQVSDDEGRTWKWKRHLERDTPGPEAGRYHYPSIIEGRDGTLHATYSHHLPSRSASAEHAARPEGKTIKYVRFNLAWIMGQ